VLWRTAWRGTRRAGESAGCGVKGGRGAVEGGVLSRWMWGRGRRGAGMSGVAGGGRKGGVEPRGAGAGARGRRRVRDAEEGEGAVWREAKESCWRPRRLAARRGGANGGAERLISASRAGGKRPGKKPGARKKGGAQGRAEKALRRVGASGGGAEQS
jgi:hypothetical protein